MSDIRNQERIWFMKKKPWGIFSGICAMLVFYLTLAFVAIYIVFGAIAAQTHSAFSMFQNWYQILIFIFDLIALGGFVYFLTMYIKTRKKEEESNDNENI